MFMQKTVSNTLLLSYILLLIELAAAERFKALSQGSAQVNGSACHYPWKHLKNYLKSTKNIDMFLWAETCMDIFLSIPYTQKYFS